MNQKSAGAAQAPPLRGALYARVSTADQNNSLQIAELTAYLARRGWEPAGIYQDTLSGARASRPGLERLLADARRGTFDAVAVWKLDRFGRSLLDCLAGIQELPGLGIRFLAVTQSIDTDQSNPTSKLLLQLLAAVAEFERELMRERVLAGMRSAQANGKHCGRPRGVVDRIELVRLREQGLSWAEVAARIEVGVGTVRRAFREACQKGLPVGAK